MNKGILGRKLGMTQVFTKSGKVVPVTVIDVEPNDYIQLNLAENLTLYGATNLVYA